MARPRRRRPQPIGTAACLLLWSVAGCGGGRSAERTDEPPTLAVPTIDTVGGVVRVRNTGPTAWADTGGWRFVLERTIHPPEGAPGELGAIASYALGGDGTVAVLQEKPARITLFDSSGYYLRTVGREGSGPGEFRQGSLGLRGDTILVHDPGQRRLSRFLQGGDFLGATPSVCCYWAERLELDDEGRFLLPEQSGQGTGGGTSRWVRFGADGRRLGTLVMLPMLAGKTVTLQVKIPGSARGMALRMPVPLSPQRLERARNDGLLLHGVTDAYRFALSRTGADTVRVIEAETGRVPLTRMLWDSVVTAAAGGGTDAIAAMANDPAMTPPTHWPAWSAMAVDPAGRLWVGLPGPARAIDRLQVFTRDGVLLGDVPLPHPALLDGHWAGDRVLVRGEDADGRPLLLLYRLDTSRPATPP